MRVRATGASALVILALTAACGGGESRSAATTPSGERLFLFGYPKADPGAVDAVHLYTLDPGQERPVRRDLPKLGIGDPLEVIHATEGRLVYYGSHGTTFSIDVALSETPRRLGASLYFVPSATPGRVWLRSTPRSNPQPARRIGIREVGVDGRTFVDGEMTRPPCRGAWIVAAVRRAVLCQVGSPAGMVAASPRTGKRLGQVRGATFPLATGGDLVAACGEPCPRLQVRDPIAKTGFALPHGPAFRWEAGYEGAFTPDQSLLAVPVRRAEAHRYRDNGRAIALVDVGAREAHLIDGSTIRRGAPVTFSSTGETLFWVDEEGAVTEYRPAEGRLRVIGSAARIRVLDLASS